MIKLFGRMIPAAARGLRGPLLHPTEVVTSPFRVLPHDIDLNRHLNNGRYLQIIDVNRMEYLLRTGIAQTILKQRWKPILGSTTIQFRRELRLWERAVASTALLGWDARWVYLEHRIATAEGRWVAVALAKAGFRSQGAWVSPEALRAALPHDLPPMVLPVQVDAWRGLDDCLGLRMGHIGPRPGAVAGPAASAAVVDMPHVMTRPLPVTAVVEGQHGHQIPRRSHG